MNLRQHLEDKDYQDTGTFRENRILKDCLISDKKRFPKKKVVHIKELSRKTWNHGSLG